MLLAFAVALFAVIHLLPAFPALKKTLKDRLGKKYGMLFALGSILSLVLIVLGWRMADRSTVYDVPSWGFSANIALSLVGFLLLAVFLMRGKVRQWLRLPLAFGVVFWSTGHLLANGDRASVILFGGLLIYALSHLIAGFVQGFRPSPEVRQGHDVLSVFIGVALFGVMIQMHQYFPGIALFSIEDMKIFAN